MSCDKFCWSCLFPATRKISDLTKTKNGRTLQSDACYHFSKINNNGLSDDEMIYMIGIPHKAFLIVTTLFGGKKFHWSMPSNRGIEVISRTKTVLKLTRFSPNLMRKNILSILQKI